MTISAWVVVCIIAVCGLIVAGFFFRGPWESDRAGKIKFSIAGAVALLITVAICGAYIWYRNNSESGRRALRDQESNLNGGIERTVSVYDTMETLSRNTPDDLTLRQTEQAISCLTMRTGNVT